MRRLERLALALLVALVLPFPGGCSLVTLDFQPKIRALEEETVEGKGSSKILMLDLSGVLSEDLPSFSLGAPPRASRCWPACAKSWPRRRRTTRCAA